MALAVLLSLPARSQAPAVRSRSATAPIEADGRTDDWPQTEFVLDPKSGTEFAFRNDGRKLYILAVVHKPEAQESLESTGMTVLNGPAGVKKPARGVLFLTRRIPAESYILWQESQGALLSDGEKAEIRRAGERAHGFAFAVGAGRSIHGPLRRQREGAPPGFGMSEGEGAARYEFEIPLVSPDIVAGGLGARPGETVRLSFEWGGAARKILGAKATRETPPAERGGLEGVATPAQEFLNMFDSLSRPSESTKAFAFAVDVRLADER
jgi:hypothetical protein